MNIQKQRRRMKMSLEDLASAVGVSRQTIINWENGVHKPHKTFQKTLYQILKPIKQEGEV